MFLMIAQKSELKETWTASNSAFHRKAELTVVDMQHDV
jgi:hypothetical protein